MHGHMNVKDTYTYSSFILCTEHLVVYTQIKSCQSFPCHVEGHAQGYLNLFISSSYIINVWNNIKLLIFFLTSNYLGFAQHECNPRT